MFCGFQVRPDTHREGFGPSVQIDTLRRIPVNDPRDIVEELRRQNIGKSVLFEDIPSFDVSIAGGGVVVAFQWTNQYEEVIHSVINDQDSPGGSHEYGFRTGLRGAVVDYLKRHRPVEVAPDDLLGSDVWEGLTAVIDVSLQHPQFGSKGQLESRPLRSLLESATRDRVGLWLETHPAEAELIVMKTVTAMIFRQETKIAWDDSRKHP